MIDADLYAALKSMHLGPRRQGGGWMSRCPSHDDRLASLSSRVTPEGKLLMYCHAGCPFVVVAQALGLQDRGTRQVTVAEIARMTEERMPDPAMLREWRSIASANPVHEVEVRERSLGIPAGGLVRMGAAWAIAIGALAAPMMNRPGGDVIGVRIRDDSGKKWAIAGSKNGLFVPKAFCGVGMLYLPEGLTDTAALVGLGLDAVGRPSCNGGRDMVRAMVKLANRPAVVVADRDTPGENGAELLASELARDGCRVRILKPPPGVKDMRAWVSSGADRETIEYAARNRAEL